MSSNRRGKKRAILESSKGFFEDAQLTNFVSTFNMIKYHKILTERWKKLFTKIEKMQNEEDLLFQDNFTPILPPTPILRRACFQSEISDSENLHPAIFSPVHIPSQHKIHTYVLSDTSEKDSDLDSIPFVKDRDLGSIFQQESRNDRTEPNGFNIPISHQADRVLV